MLKVKNITRLLLLILVFSSCKNSSVIKDDWGVVDNKPVYLYTISNKNGMELKMTNYGGIITSIMVPDKNGVIEDVVLGFDSLKQYIAPNPCFGATIGRFANRIKNGEFTINDSVYHVVRNDNGKNHLHGGMEFNHAVWDSKIVNNELGTGLELRYFSKDGTNGFPGNVQSVVTYTLTDNNAIHVKFEATTDKATHINFTNHSYFNLSACKDLIYNHKVRLDADEYVNLDMDAIATGEILDLKGKAWSLKETTRLGDSIQNIPLKGYHHCYVLNKPEGELTKVMWVEEPNSGRTLEVSTTQPGIVLYASNVLSDEIVGKYGIRYGQHMALCMETQGYPGAPNHANFPSTLLQPNEKYEEIAIYDFGVVEE